MGFDKKNIYDAFKQNYKIPSFPDSDIPFLFAGSLGTSAEVFGDLTDDIYNLFYHLGKNCGPVMPNNIKH